MNSLGRITKLFLAAATLLLCDARDVPSLMAGEVSVRLSSRETYVGLPITMQVRIDDAGDYRIGDLPEVDGLRIVSAGRPTIQRRRSRINNGPIQTKTTAVYPFRVIPERDGTFTIPPIEVIVDGKRLATDEIRIVASTSETGDLLLVEVTGAKDAVYVGEPLELKLNIWVRPYRDRDRQVELTEGSMWGQLSTQTKWGIFSDRMAELRQPPGGRELLRKDSEGNDRSYYRYVIDATVYPDRPGTLNSDDLQIAMMYPTALGEQRDPIDEVFDSLRRGSGPFGDDAFGGPLFGPGPDPFENMRRSRLAITSVRPIVAKADIKSIEVRPVPMEGRPQGYRGAVGTYEIVTEATPGPVKAGDPISLRIGISGSGPLDLVRAPPLHKQTDLTQDFRVPDVELPGFVSNGLKRFATTIRPRKEGITEIPPIRFSYFDPVSEKFVTAKSEPIQIEVGPADTLSLDSIIAAPSPGPRSQPSQSTSSVTPTPSVYAGDLVLRPESPATLFPMSFWWGLLLPPMVCAVFCVIVGRERIHGIAGLFRSAMGQFEADIEAADSFGQIATALESFLGRKYPAPKDLNRRSWVVGQLRADGLGDLAVRSERAFAKCERKESLGYSEAASLKEFKSMVRDLGDEIVSSKSIRSGQARKKKASGSLATTFLLGIMLAGAAEAVAGESDVSPSAIALSPSQQSELLREANEHFSASERSSKEDARVSLETAASRYQALIDSGVTNSKLYFNLATAQARVGQHGLAIANYRRALRIDPYNREFLNALSKTEADLAGVRAESDQELSSASRFEQVQRLWMLLLTPNVVYLVSLFSWIGVWIVLAVRFKGVDFAWKSSLAFLVIVFALNTTFYFSSLRQFTRSDMAVLSTDDVELREGDGDEFSVKEVIPLGEGMVVRALQSRDGWVKVDAGSDRIGWVKLSSVERI